MGEVLVQIGEAIKATLNILPGIIGVNVYWMSTRFNTKIGASGSAVGTGLPVPTVPHDVPVHVTQFDVRLVPVPLIPEAELQT